MNEELYLLGRSKKKLVSAPQGSYNGIVQKGLCYLYDRTGDIFYRFDSDIKQRDNKVLEVIVKIDAMTAKIYMK